MLIHFHIHYKVSDQSRVQVDYRFGDKQVFLNLRSYDNGHWFGSLHVNGYDALHYRYRIVSDQQTVEESGVDRFLEIKVNQEELFCEDCWRPRRSAHNLFLTTAFSEVLFKRKAPIPTVLTSFNKRSIRFSLRAADINPKYRISISGNCRELGNWKFYLPLSDADYPNWSIEIPVMQEILELEYKYLLQDIETGELVQWEVGGNRVFKAHFPVDKRSTIVLSDEEFRFDSAWWRAAGIAIPVFSLRSQQGFGIGEYMDLNHMVDLAKSSSFKIIQVLPINDTIAKKTWEDSYPYAAISVYALHPLYISIDAVGTFSTKKLTNEYEQKRKQLNALDTVDFEEVLYWKFYFLEKLFQQEKSTFFKSKSFQAFYEKESNWLDDYAIFCYLRDINGTVNFNEWPAYRVHQQHVYDLLDAKQNPDYERIQFYYFIQYHAYQQLSQVKSYAREHGVVLKGDLPIGIYRYSCDAWVHGRLFNMEEQAGAPPDDYAVLGQNWGFPTYNWLQMSEDQFAWWKSRMSQLSLFFDALRIDHILGFFRIWQVPLDQIQGTIGRFNPRLPYTLEELHYYGIHGDLSRYTSVFIRYFMLEELFGAEASYVAETYLEELWEGAYTFATGFGNQMAIQQHIEKEMKDGHLLEGLLHLVSEVLLFQEEDGEAKTYSPRISLQSTYSYKYLSDYEKRCIDRLYLDYFYNRHNAFWKDQAMWKLPPLLDATDMLICGEDLGMIPASVPEVMSELNILPLEIQRMPKRGGYFGDPAAYDYYSVCSPSCHDMSTVRAWWEGNPMTRQRFYNDFMGKQGLAPETCTTDIVRFILESHAQSPSMLVIFPLQDLVGMLGNLRKDDAFSEQINDPSNSKHYWRYRFHINLETLKLEASFIDALQSLARDSDRS